MHNEQQPDRKSNHHASAGSDDNTRFITDRLGRALHDVPVPAGLAGRILDRLAAGSLNGSAAGGVDAVVLAPMAIGDDAVGLATAPAVVPRRGRRWVIGGLLATAATLLLAWLGYEQLRPVWPADVLLEQVVLFHQQRAAQPVALSARPLPISHQIAQPADATIGQRLSGLPGRRGTSYDLRYKKLRATLYVVSVRATGLPVAPPQQPVLASGGHAAAAWQEGSLAYILVVEGGQRQYRQVVDPQQPIAFAFLPASAN